MCTNRGSPSSQTGDYGGGEQMLTEDEFVDLVSARTGVLREVVDGSSRLEMDLG